MRTLNIQRIQHTTGTAEVLRQKNPLLLEGEIIFESDTSKAKVGDGVHTWNELDYWHTEISVASNEDTDKMIDEVFGKDVSPTGTNADVATDNEIDDMLDEAFGN